MATTTQPRKSKAPDTRPFWRRHFLKLTVTPLGIIIAIWFLIIQPHTTKTVDEAFPTAAPVRTTITAAQPAATTVPTAQVAILQPTAQPTLVAATQPTAAATVTVAAPTAAPTLAPTAPAPTVASGPVAVKSGDFVAVEHSGSGKATIFKQADGTYILRFENLDVTNGPDLRVRLLGAGGTSIDLGGLKGNKGNQNYALPADFDPAKYDTADIWCRAFKSQFNTAALT